MPPAVLKIQSIPRKSDLADKRKGFGILTCFSFRLAKITSDAKSKEEKL
jgi:hypothetical protein